MFRESGAELNFLQKTQWKLIFVSPRSEAGAPNICRVLELKSKLFLGLKASKIIDCIDNCFKQKLYKIKFPTKNSTGACLYLPSEWS